MPQSQAQVRRRIEEPVETAGDCAATAAEVARQNDTTRGRDAFADNNDKQREERARAAHRRDKQRAALIAQLNKLDDTDDGDFDLTQEETGQETQEAGTATGPSAGAVEPAAPQPLAIEAAEPSGSRPRRRTIEDVEQVCF